MFPFIRLAIEILRVKFAGPMDVAETHTTSVRVFPNDIDIFMELNNGRTLTLFDIARLSFGVQVGLWHALKVNKWGLTVAGSSVRYRRRIRMFQKVRITSKAVGRDARFIYIVQTMYRGKEATSNVLYRSALTDENGIVPTQKFADFMGQSDWNPKLPEWVENWIKAEDTRDWPPQS
jgi:acyl-CoA thioesterase FadM